MDPVSPVLHPEADPAAGAHLSEEDVARYVDELLAGRGPRLPGPLLAHVEDCPACQGQILDVLCYLRDPLLDAEGIPTLRPQAAAKGRPSWLWPAMRAAAAALFLLLLAVHFWLPRRPAPQSAPEPGAGLPRHPQAQGHEIPAAPVIAPRTAPKAMKRTAVEESGGADAFAVNPNLEAMVDSRSRGLVVEVQSPPNRATLRGEITFSWRDFGREGLSLSIVNNRNEMIFSTSVRGGSQRFPGALPPGCYYWKLESATELYYVGKFFVAAAPTPPEG